MENEKKNKKLIIIIVSLIVLIGIGVVLFLLFNKPKDIKEKDIEYERPLVYISIDENNKYSLKVLDSQMEKPITIVDNYNPSKAPNIKFNDNYLFVVDSDNNFYYFDVKNRAYNKISDNAFSNYIEKTIYYFKDGDIYEYDPNSGNSYSIYKSSDNGLASSFYKTKNGYYFVTKDITNENASVNELKNNNGTLKLEKIDNVSPSTLNSDGTLNTNYYLLDDKVYYLTNKDNIYYDFKSYDFKTKKIEELGKTYKLEKIGNIIYNYAVKDNNDFKTFIQENVINNYSDENKDLFNKFYDELTTKVLTKFGWPELGIKNVLSEEADILLFDLKINDKVLIKDSLTQYSFNYSKDPNGFIVENIVYSGNKYDINDLENNIDNIANNISLKKSLVYEASVYDFDYYGEKTLQFEPNKSYHTIKTLNNSFVFLACNNGICDGYYGSIKNPKGLTQISSDIETIYPLADDTIVYTKNNSHQLYKYDGNKNILISEEGYYRGSDKERNLYYFDGTKDFGIYRFNTNGNIEQIFDNSKYIITPEMEMINKNNIYIIDFQKYANDEAYSLYRYKDGITELIEESVVYYK